LRLGRTSTIAAASDRGQANLVGRVSNFCAMSADGTEIERKFLVTELPTDLDRNRCEVIEQGYIAITDDGLEVRIRRGGEHAVLTIKKGKGRTRLEEELDIDAERAERLWALTEGRRLKKTRCAVPAPGDLTFEVDIYAGELEGLVTAEVEFSSESAAQAFEPPDWFGRDVTEDSRYKNQWLACHGLPPDKRGLLR
jgi:adenylate cyclase